MRKLKYQILLLTALIALLILAMVLDRTYIGVMILLALCWFAGETLLPARARPFHSFLERKRE